MSKSGEFAVEVFMPTFNLTDAIAETALQGYLFTDDALTEEIRRDLLEEVDTLPADIEDRVTRPINRGKPNEVRQQYGRSYHYLDDEDVPAANNVANLLSDAIRAQSTRFPELNEWQATELGYQVYRPGDIDYISPHRDRASDKLLSITITISGSAIVRVLKTLGDFNDYSRLEQIDEFSTIDGSVMFLRAPGLANGERVVHQVLPPVNNIRKILNLRMRDRLLPAPSNY
jgi:alkylated DNA repair dioxygenase AlkB